MHDNPLASLPQIETLLSLPETAVFERSIGRTLVKRAARTAVDRFRNEIREAGSAGSGRGIPSLGEVAAAVVEECRRIEGIKIRRVINGTGVVLHTNLGRSPLDRNVWKTAESVNCGYSSLELDLTSGKRGGRTGLIPELLSSFLGCESALVVNNNAAAVYLILSEFGRGRDVLVSRGEQIQIGGGFRIPEILEQTGARLVEVGTTNITTVDDFLRSVTPVTGLCLRVHTSNYAVRGFARTPGIRELRSALPDEVPLIMDQGSGAITESIPGESAAGEYLNQGADLVCFSADKLFGGPQAGIIVGKDAMVRRLSSHPLMRVFRPGKTIYSLLEEHLIRRINGGHRIPGDSIREDSAEAEKTAHKILEGIDPFCARIVSAEFSLGGGSSPDEYFPTRAIEIAAAVPPETIMEKMRAWKPPIIGVIHDGLVRIFPITLFPEDIPSVRSFLEQLQGEKA